MTDTQNPGRQRARLPGRSHREYRRALRHSLWVRVMKFTFPMVAVLVMAGFFGASILNAALPSNIKVDRTAIEGGKLVMSDPVLTGQNAEGELYKLTASRATQDLANPNVITLENIEARLPIGGGATATIQAESAVYDRKTEVVTFNDPFQVDTDSGMTAKLEQARFDMRAGQLISKAPVKISTEQGDLVARSMRMRDNGKTIEFNDRVRMTVQPSTIRPKKEDEAN